VKTRFSMICSASAIKKPRSFTICGNQERQISMSSNPNNDAPSTAAAKQKNREQRNAEAFAKVLSQPPARPMSAAEKKRAILRGC